MKDRFSKKNKTERSRMNRKIKKEVLCRDDNTCQFCGEKFNSPELTIDHLIPVSNDGLDEIINYVTCCKPCNQKKANKPLHEFAKSIGIKIEELPVHGDPVIDNEALPLQIRLLRKRVIDRSRKGKIRISGTSAQKKLEKAYRRSFWETQIGKELESEFPKLPGQVRIMIPEIQTIAKNSEEYLLLIELAKSAVTRNLIGSILSSNKDIVKIIEAMKDQYGDEKVRKRIKQAWERYQKEVRKREKDSDLKLKL